MSFWFTKFTLPSLSPINFLRNVLHTNMHMSMYTHTHTLYFFTWWGPSYKYGIRPNYCDIIWRLDFFWCQYRCLYNVIFTRIAATSSCGFQFINVSILKRKDCIRQCTRNLNNGCWLFSPLLSPKFMTNCKFSALCPETSLLTW